MSRLLLALSLVLSAAPAFAQPGDWLDRHREALERQRQTLEERRAALQQRLEQRRDAWQARRQAWEDRANQRIRQWEDRADQRVRQWEDWTDRRGRDGVHLRVLRDYRVTEGTTVHEPVVVIGGSATIDGHVEDDVVVIGGRLRLGPKAVVDGDVFTAGEKPSIDPGAKVQGKIDEALVDLPDVDFGWGVGELPPGLWRFASLGATVMRLGMIFTIAMLLTLIAPGWIRAMAGRASSVGGPGFLGFLVEVLFVPTLLVISIALLISVIGIPLLAVIPFLLAAGALFWIGGFAAVAVALGARLRGSRGDDSSVPLLDLLTGFFAITGVSIIANFMSFASGWTSGFGWFLHAAGLAIEYFAWTIGLGAALSTFFAGRRGVPPPVPATA